MPKRNKRLGKLPPQYRFFLNHYQEFRFTRCPECDRPMKVRKYPFLVHVDPLHLLMVNMPARYCPVCDLLILHHDKLGERLVAGLLPRDPDVIGSEYLVLGTVEREAWRDSRKIEYDWKMALDNLHDFKEVVLIEVEYSDWESDE